jgi:hypothetical protein
MPDLVVDTSRASGQIWTSRSWPEPSDDGLRFSLRCVHPERRVGTGITNAAFNCRGDAIAALNEHGQVVGLELQHNRYTLLRRGGSSGVSVAYSGTLATELFIGLADGSIECFDTEKRLVVGTVRGHRRAIRSLHCHHTQPLLLSCSVDALVLWSTRTLSRVRHWSATPARPLVCAALPPSGEFVLACLEHKVRVWRSSNFTTVATHKLPPAYAGLRLRAVAVNSTSSLAAAAGDSGVVALFSLRTHELLKLLQLPAGSSIGQAVWLPRSDHLALVCDDGTLQVARPTAEEVSLVLQPDGGKTRLGYMRLAVDLLGHSMAALRTDGSLALHSLEPIAQRISGGEQTNSAPAPAPIDGPRATLPSSTALARPVQRLVPAANAALSPAAGPPQKDFYRAPVELAGVNVAKLLPLYQIGALPDTSPLLDVPRLRGVLRRSGRFPDKHRTLVWRFLLQLPHNVAAHRGLADKGPHPAHAALHARTSIRDRRLSGRLERTLSCLAHWCPLFGEAVDLDAAVFPWVLAFDGDEVATFEAAATVLANWGQRFYECHPYPPVELLAGVASLLAHHAPMLAAHLEMLGAHALQWAWPLLDGFFSRNLARDDWLVLWDHLLSHEPVFMLLAVVAYAKLHAPALLQATSAQQACEALHAESCLRPALWMRTTYAMLRSTPDRFFPRWAPFSPLPAGPVYPRRVEFPKSVVGFGFAEVARIKASEAELMERRYREARLLTADQEAGAARSMADERRRQMEAEEASAREAMAARQAHLLRASRGPSYAVGEAAVAEAEAAAQRARAVEGKLEVAHAQRMARIEAEARAAEAGATRRSRHWEETARLWTPVSERAKAENAGVGKNRPLAYGETTVAHGDQGCVQADGLVERDRARGELEQVRRTVPSSEQQQAASLAVRRGVEDAGDDEARATAGATMQDPSHGSSVQAAALAGSSVASAPAHLLAQAPSASRVGDMGSVGDALFMPATTRLADRLPDLSSASSGGGASPAPHTVSPHPPSAPRDPRLVHEPRSSDPTSQSAGSDDGAQLEELLRALRQQRAEHSMGFESEAVLKRLLLQHGIATASAGGDVAAPGTGTWAAAPPAGGALAPEGGASALPNPTAGAFDMRGGDAGTGHSTPELQGEARHRQSTSVGASGAEPGNAARPLRQAEQPGASLAPSISALPRPQAFAGPLAESPSAAEITREHGSGETGTAVPSAVGCQHKAALSSGASEPAATLPPDDFHAFVPTESPMHTALPSSAPCSSTHGLPLEGLGSHLRARLASEARAGRISVNYMTPGVGSAASGSNCGEPDALGGLRLSGLPTGLRQQLRGCAEEGRALGLEMAVSGITRDPPGLSSPQSSRQQAAQHAGAGAGGLDSWSGGQVEDWDYPSDASPCATCELLADRFDSHEAWVQSLRARTDAIMATHVRAQEGLASLMPSSYPSSGDAFGASGGWME